MLDFKPVSYRLPVAPPRVLRQAPNHSFGLGSSSPYKIGQTFDQLFSWGYVTGDIIRLLFHGTTAALGYHVWLKDKGFWKYFGLLLAFGQTVGGICDVISLGKRIAGTHPPEMGH